MSVYSSPKTRIIKATFSNKGIDITTVRMGSSQTIPGVSLRDKANVITHSIKPKDYLGFVYGIPIKETNKYISINYVAPSPVKEDSFSISIGEFPSA